MYTYYKFAHHIDARFNITRSATTLNLPIRIACIYRAYGLLGLVSAPLVRVESCKSCKMKLKDEEIQNFYSLAEKPTPRPSV